MCGWGSETGCFLDSDVGGGCTSVGFGSVGGGTDSCLTLLVSGVGCGGTVPLQLVEAGVVIDSGVQMGADCCRSGLFLHGEISSTRGAHLYTGVFGGLVSVSGGVVEDLVNNLVVLLGDSSFFSLTGLDVQG